MLTLNIDTMIPAEYLIKTVVLYPVFFASTTKRGTKIPQTLCIRATRLLCKSATIGPEVWARALSELIGLEGCRSF